MAVDEVDIVRVHYQQIRSCVVKEEVLVCLDDLFNVVIADCRFTRSVFPPQTPLQNFRTCLQVDDKIGRGQLFAEIVVVTVINSQLGIVEVDAGKQLVLFESVVADDRLVRIALQRAQLIKPGHEEGKLRLKCSAGLTIVKSRKERIVFGLSDALRVQPVRNNARERALAYANRTVQGDVPGGIEELGHKPGLLGA